MARKRTQREEWICPRCGLTGDHLRSPDPTRCTHCCRIDAADDLYNALVALLTEEPLDPGHVWTRRVRDDARAAITKAEGRS